MVLAMVVCVCLAKAEGDEESASVAELPSFYYEIMNKYMKILSR